MVTGPVLTGLMPSVLPPKQPGFRALDFTAFSVGSGALWLMAAQLPGPGRGRQLQSPLYSHSLHGMSWAQSSLHPFQLVDEPERLLF